MGGETIIFCLVGVGNVGESECMGNAMLTVFGRLLTQDKMLHMPYVS